MSGPVAFPYAIDAAGHTAAAAPDKAIAELLEQILFVEPGERINRPDFGCALRSLTFASRTSELTAAIEALVEAALRRWAGEKVRVQSVDVAVGDSVATVKVRYVDPVTETVRAVTVSN